jgi:hypothetical protein
MPGGLVGIVHPVEQGRASHVTQGGIAQKTEEQQPDPKESQKKILIGKLSPAFQEFDPKFFQNADIVSARK